MGDQDKTVVESEQVRTALLTRTRLWWILNW